MIYLDHAATSLLKPASVAYAMNDALRSMASPGRGGHQPAMRAAETVFRCRMAAGRLFHVQSPDQVVFTMNATHGLNLAINSLTKAESHVLISGFEHNSVTRPLFARNCQIRVAGRTLFEQEDTLRCFAEQIDWADLVVCTAVSNVFGYILPIEEISKLCRKKGVPLIIDASQAAGVIDLDFESLGAAYMAMPGHKSLLGPQGTGILLCSSSGDPLLYGGSGSESRNQSMPEYLPDRMEAGTQNVCGIAGLLAGLEYVLSRTISGILEHECALLRAAKQELSDAACTLFSGAPSAQSGVLSLRSERVDCETIAQMLAERGICVRSGLHCAPLAHESADTLDTGTLRLSFSPFTEEDEVRSACRTLRGLL